MYNIKGNEGMCNIMKNGSIGETYNIEMLDDGNCSIGSETPYTTEHTLDCSWLKLKIHSEQEKIKIRDKLLFKLMDCRFVG